MLTGAGKATLTVYGYDQASPGESASDKTTTAGEWVKLSVQFTPIQCSVGVTCWGVISLEQDGQCEMYWDDVKVS
jgi:hypothetical protein